MDGKETEGDGAGGGDTGNECFVGTENQLGKMRKFWSWRVAMVAPYCECT